MLTSETEELLPSTSPAQSISERARLEEEFRSLVWQEARLLVVGLAEEALARLDARTEPLTAAAVPRLPLTVGAAQSAWDAASRRLIREMARILGMKIPRNVASLDPYLLHVMHRIAESALPGDAVKAALDALTLARTDPLAAREALRKMRDITAWAKHVNDIARTEGTAVHSFVTIKYFNDHGYTHKEWISVRDSRTRHAHAEARGQKVLVNEPFLVGGSLMMVPGDPSAPVELTINCRCILRGHKETR